MKLDLSFWRVILTIKITKDLTWGKGGDTYFIHFGSFSDGNNTAYKITFFPLLIMFGFIKG